MTNHIWEKQEIQDNIINWVESIETLKEQTKVSILDTFYRDEWVFFNVFSIITGKKMNPSDLVTNLKDIRGEYKKLDSDQEAESQKAA